MTATSSTTTATTGQQLQNKQFVNSSIRRWGKKCNQVDERSSNKISKKNSKATLEGGENPSFPATRGQYNTNLHVSNYGGNLWATLILQLIDQLFCPYWCRVCFMVILDMRQALAKYNHLQAACQQHQECQPVPHPSTALARCCLTSVIAWELVNPACKGHWHFIQKDYSREITIVISDALSFVAQAP